MRAKDLNDAYRAAAEKLLFYIDGCGHIKATDLRVSPHGLVQPSEGGAFVELMLWVPEEALEKTEQ